MELEDREVVLEAQVECELPPGDQCHVTCQQHQVRAPVLTSHPVPRRSR